MTPYESLVDDAALFPPGNAALPDAVTAHHQHRRAPYANLVGSFVISDSALPDLLRELRTAPSTVAGPTEQPTEPLGVAVVVTGGAGALEPAVRWAAGANELDLRAVEIALRDESDLAHNARRMATAVAQLVVSGHLGEDVAVYVEPPRLYGEPPSHSWLSALDELAATDLRLKFRTGGLAADAFPSASELADCIESALDRELRLKCTAGLHHALRHRDDTSGFEHHGFLNVLLATRATLDGACPRDVADLLDCSDPSILVNLIARTGSAALMSARSWFTSFGSCSVSEPVEDLVGLGLLPDSVLQPAPQAAVRSAPDTARERT